MSGAHMAREYPSGPYPIDFMPPTSEAMNSIFDRVGLGAYTEADHQRARKLRKELIDQGTLLTLKRPTRKPNPVIYFHPGYTEAAFEDAPPLGDFPTRKSWLTAIGAHLESFAEDSSAAEIVGGAITTYYNRIADVAVLLPDFGKIPWIAVSQTTEAVCPLDYVGVLYRDANITPGNTHTDWKNSHGKRYFRLQALARNIGWGIPGVESPEMQTAIVGGFEATHDANRVVDPQKLFMYGKVAVQGADRPIKKVFVPHPVVEYDFTEFSFGVAAEEV